MFWRAKSPLDPGDEAWQLECWAWLLRNLGGVGLLRATALVLPTRDFFRPLTSTGHAFAAEVLDQVAAYFGFEPGDFRLVAQASSINPQVGAFAIVQNAPASPLGTFSHDDDHATITYDPRLVERPGALIATLAHELCHARLLPVATPPPGGWEMEEFATDLAAAFFGFGVFSANEASRFEAFSDQGGGTQGWRFSGGGYLSPAERAFALAMFLALTKRKPDQARPHLEGAAAAYFNKAVKYLAAHPSIAANLAG